MRTPALIGLLALPLLGCVSAGTTAPPVSFVGIVGTPFLVAMKIPVCGASIVLAGPIAAGATLAVTGPDANAAEAGLLGELDDGLNRNCGPPYVVAP